jgi:hypothetical protein
LFRRDFEGIQPTLRQVPPRVPRFSIHAVFRTQVRNRGHCRRLLYDRGARRSHLQACLTSLNSRDISSNTTTNDNQVVLLCSILGHRSALLILTPARPQFLPGNQGKKKRGICAPDAVARPRFENPIKEREGAGTTFEGTARGAAVRRTDRGVARGSIVRNMTVKGE